MIDSEPRSLVQAWIALAGLSAVFLFEMLDNSILNVALPTIGRDLSASSPALQWVTNGYAATFGGLMLAFGAVADRFGRRRIMLIGLVLLGAASLATAFVSSVDQLIAVRVVTGVAAAMTTPGSMALAFRLFDHDEHLRIRAITFISTVGLVGLAIGPTGGGFVLAFAPWQVLLLANVPIAVLAFVGIHRGVAHDGPDSAAAGPADVLGGVLGTGFVVFALVAPTLFVIDEVSPRWAWAACAGALALGAAFVRRERSVAEPLLDLSMVARPSVSSGLAFKAATGLAVAGMGYLVTLQLQLDWGWSPGLAAVGMLPQVIVLVAGGPFVNWFIGRVGIRRAAWSSASAVVLGLGVYASLSNLGYIWVAMSLVLVAAGMRVIGVVAGVTVLSGLPSSRTSMGAALVDTASQVAAAVGVAIAGTLLAGMFVGTVTDAEWTPAQSGQFENAVVIAGLTLALLSAGLVGYAIVRSRRAEPATSHPTYPGGMRTDLSSQ